MLISDSIHFIILNTQCLKLRVFLCHPYRKEDLFYILHLNFLECNSKPPSVVLGNLCVAAAVAAAAVYIFTGPD
jgi:hypothetical protein